MYLKTSDKPTFLYPRYTFFHKETRFTVLILNRQHVFHLESETLWCSGYKKNFQTWWALAPTDTLCCVIELVTSQNVCAYFFI